MIKSHLLLSVFRRLSQKVTRSPKQDWHSLLISQSQAIGDAATASCLRSFDLKPHGARRPRLPEAIKSEFGPTFVDIAESVMTSGNLVTNGRHRRTPIS
jgi:hypothetical protein